jgi:hypothetical protein
MRAASNARILSYYVGELSVCATTAILRPSVDYKGYLAKPKPPSSRAHEVVRLEPIPLTMFAGYCGIMRMTSMEAEHACVSQLHAYTRRCSRV